MAKYFNYFPKTFYSANSSTSILDSVTNIIARFGFQESLKENSSAFYKYQIQEGDTPEIIAQKYYNNSERHWVVLIFNNLIDPQYDWPLPYKSFVEYVDQKYSTSEYADTANTSVSGISWALNTSNIHSYYKIITRTSTTDAKDNIIEKLEIDANTYANVAVTTQTITLQSGKSITETITKETKTYYTFENELNESKREIKLLKPEFVSSVEKEFRKIIKE
jgi:hypothetical protein